MQVRYRILDYWTSSGWVSKVETRREHVDPPHDWHHAFSTEPYGKEEAANRRARQWVYQNLPAAVK
jgi:hypothetical protein